MNEWAGMSVEEKMLLVMRVGAGTASEDELDMARRNA